MNTTMRPADKIYNFLKKTTNKLYTKQIMSILKLSNSETRTGIRTLIQRNMLTSEYDGHGTLYYYDDKHEKIFNKLIL